MNIVGKIREVFGPRITWDLAAAAWGYLAHFGHLPADPSDVTFGDLARAVQWLGRAMDRVESTGQQTAAAVLEGMFELQRCGCPDFLRAEQARGKWGKRHLTYGLILPVVQGVSVERQKAIMAANFAATSAVCGLTFAYAEPGGVIDLPLFAVRIDGAGKVLGQQYLPNGADKPLRGELDTGERWDESLFERTQKHEQCGHGCGLEHNNDPGNLMNPYLAKSAAWGSTDKRHLVELYGAPTASGGSGTSPSPTPSGEQTLIIGRDLPAGTYRLVRMAGLEQQGDLA